MVNDTRTLLDRAALQKYLYLLTLLATDQIDIAVFESLFLQIRREDDYWLSGRFDERISRILDAFFLDIDAYASDDFFDPGDKFNINGIELIRRAKETLMKLKEY